MPRVTRIDRADAFAAIETIIKRGEAPTHVNVRSELGQRGSPPVISNFISSWFAVYGPSLIERASPGSATAIPAAAEAAPSGDNGSIAALTAAALAQIQKAAEEREQQHAKQREADLAAVQQEREGLEASRRSLEEQYRVHEQHVQRAYQDRDAALKERDLALADAAGIRLALATAKAQLQQLQEQMVILERIEARLAELKA